MLRCEHVILASKAYFEIAFLRRKNEIMASKAFFIIVIFDANMRFWSRMPSSKLHFSTQKCDSGPESSLQNCILRRKNAILASRAFFKIAFFDAKMRFWPRKPSGLGLVASWLLAEQSFSCLVRLLAEWLSWLDCLWSRTGLARMFAFHFSFFFTGRVGVDAAANGLHHI